MNYYTGENEGEEDMYVCGDCGLECSLEDRVKYIDTQCSACKDELRLIREDCDHEYESYGRIETETDFYGMKDLVGWECIHCKKSFEEWTYRN